MVDEETFCYMEREIMKYSKELTEKICKHLKEGNTIIVTCEAVGINQDTFHDPDGLK